MIQGARKPGWWPRRLLRAAAAGLCLLAAPQLPVAERLPVRVFGPRDGLPHTRVKEILQDSHGYLWFATAQGLGRYDGGRFTTYDSSNGLPGDEVNDILETRTGEHWIATEAGVCVLDRSAGEGAFRRIDLAGAEERISAESLHEDASGALWAGTDRGLHRLDRSAAPWIFRHVPLTAPGAAAGPGTIHSILEEADGGLWVGAAAGLFRMREDGSVERFTFRPSGARQAVRDLMPDGKGLLWIGHEEGLIIFQPGPPASAGASHQPVSLEEIDLTSRRLDEELPSSPGVARRYTMGETITRRVVRGIERAGDGRIRILQVGRGLVEILGGEVRRYTKEHGLADDTLNAAVEDRAGDLWLGSDAAGAMRISRSGILSYGGGDGLGHTFITSIFEGPGGSLWTISGNFHLSRLEGGRFRTGSLTPPRGETDPYFFSTGMMDVSGGLWAPTKRGLYRFPPPGEVEGLGSAAPEAIYAGPGDGMGEPTGVIHQDRGGDIWFGVMGSGVAPLIRWERGTGRLEPAGGRGGLADQAIVSAMEDGPDGALWIALAGGQVGPLTDAGFRPMGAAEGLPAGWINDLHFDAAGRLWIASSREGLARVDSPGGGAPRTRLYRRDDGLCGSRVRSLTEDRFGRIYAGTTRGVCRLDPDSGRFSQLGSSDGLPNDEVLSSFRDSRGDLWFGTLDGLSRLSPRPGRSAVPPAVRIGAVVLSGERLPLGELGAEKVEGPRLPSSRSHVRIDYLGIPYSTSEEISYEYRLAGADSRWSPPTGSRSVTYARLSPGSYRFEVRAVGEAGQVSIRPAVASFTILPPFYRTAWFAALVAGSLATAAWILHRRRLARAVAVERLRTRIATDLHDDVGSNLSQIAIAAELIRRRGSGPDAESSRLLGQIAEVSRETVDTMSDIVWAISPSKDRLDDLAHRMRRFASDLLAAREVRLELEISAEIRRSRLGINARRQLFLIFKEAVHNAVRHSGCRSLRILLRREGARLRLTIGDDGEGFDPDSGRDGHGLGSMKARAAEAGGSLEIISSPGAGTTVEALIPLHSRSRSGRAT